MGLDASQCGNTQESGLFPHRDASKVSTDLAAIQYYKTTFV